MTIIGSTISGNSTSGDGGGVWSDDSTVLIVSSTVTGNTAGGVGGGISLRADNFNNDERLTIRNSIVAGNSDNGTAPDFEAPGDPANDLIVEFSLVGDTTGSGVTPSTGPGNLLDVDPLLGPLADNGGPTLTHSLLPGSPAIDAGAALVAVGGLYGTGVVSPGELVLDDQADPHYELNTQPGGGLVAVAITADGFPIGPWVANSALRDGSAPTRVTRSPWPASTSTARPST